MHAPPRFILMLTLIGSAALLVSAAVGTIAGLRGQEYFFAGFELVLAISGFIGVFIGMGRFNQGPSVAIACVAGATAMCSLLGYVTLGGEILLGGRLIGAHGEVLGVDVFGFFMLRMFVAGVLAAMAGLVLVLRDPKRSVPMLVRGIVLGVPVVVALGLWVAVPGFRTMVLGWHVLVQVFLGSIGLMVGIGLVSASGHCLIRAFEIGVEVAREWEEESAGSKKAPPLSRSATSPPAGESAEEEGVHYGGAENIEQTGNKLDT
jgi:hypothetical protein